MMELTEYETLMNAAAKTIPDDEYPYHRNTTSLFIDYMDDRTACYSHKNIQRDAPKALNAVRDGKVWRDYNNRKKWNPEHLAIIRENTSQNIKPEITDEDDMVAGVLASIHYSSKSTKKKRSCSRKVIR